MTDDPETVLLEELIGEITDLLPPAWLRATLTYRSIGDHEVIHLGGTEPDGGYAANIRRAALRVPRTAIPSLVRRHREITSDPERGAWAAFSYKLWNEKGFDWGVSARAADDFPWTDEVTPADCAAEIRKFPRRDEHVPAWMRSLLDLHQAAESFPGVQQSEAELVALLPNGMDDLFVRARRLLADYVPSAAPLRGGAPGQGAWTVAHHGGAWLAIGPDGEIVPYAEPLQAVAHAMAGIMTGARMEINSAVLDTVQIIYVDRGREAGQEAWMLGELGRELSARTKSSPRPRTPGPYISLDMLHNRPSGYFVCFPGPAPEEGPYISVHDVCMRLAKQSLPEPPPKPQPPPPERPIVVLEPGMIVDAHGRPDAGTHVFEIGTPFLRRGLVGFAEDHEYHVYRVEQPIRTYPGLFAPGPIGSDPPPPETGMGYHLGGYTVSELVASGHLVDITDEHTADQTRRPEGTP